MPPKTPTAPTINPAAIKSAVESVATELESFAPEGGKLTARQALDKLKADYPAVHKGLIGALLSIDGKDGTRKDGFITKDEIADAVKDQELGKLKDQLLNDPIEALKQAPGTLRLGMNLDKEIGKHLPAGTSIDAHDPVFLVEKLIEHFDKDGDKSTISDKELEQMANGLRSLLGIPAGATPGVHPRQIQDSGPGQEVEPGSEAPTKPALSIG